MVTGCAGYLVYLLHPLTCKHCAHRLPFVISEQLQIDTKDHAVFDQDRTVCG